MGGMFVGRRYLRGKTKKSKIKKCGRDIAWDVFLGIFTIKEGFWPNGLPKFAKFSPAAPKNEENCNEIKSNFAVMSKEQRVSEV